MLSKNVFEKIARRFSKLSFFNQWKFKIEAVFFSVLLFRNGYLPLSVSPLVKKLLSP